MSQEEKKARIATIVSDAKKKAATAGRKTVDFSKKMADGMQKSVKTLSEQTKKNIHEQRVKKYNPLFPDKYFSESFCVPNMIVIVDDAVRRHIDVCEGSIGWIGKEKNLEILYLYDEAVEMSGLHFIPSATCDSVYYIDSFDRTSFIKTDSIFAKAHEERLAELAHIARCLGAKSCSVEIVESDEQKETKSFKHDRSTGGKIAGIDIDSSDNTTLNTQTNNYVKRHGKIVTRFSGSITPQKPNLKWFAYDNTIKELIDTCCAGNNTVKSQILELQGSSSATMSQKTASTIDQAIEKIGCKVFLNMEKQVNKELYSKLIFEIKF